MVSTKCEVQALAGSRGKTCFMNQYASYEFTAEPYISVIPVEFKAVNLRADTDGDALPVKLVLWDLQLACTAVLLCRQPSTCC